MKNNIIKNRNRQSSFSWILCSFIIICITMGIIGCTAVTDTASTKTSDLSDAAAKDDAANKSQNTDRTKSKQELLTLHFIDVGQGDATLIECAGQYMLIDAGENNKGDIVTAYLNNLGIEKIDYLIGTHPHSDHIGGLDIIIDNFDIGIFIMPEIEHTTKVFEDVLDAAIRKNLSLTIPSIGKKYELGNAEFIIIAPNDDYKNNLNNYSVGIKLTYGENSFVFTGDAEISAEYDIMDNGIDISADIFHSGHHGSDTSNSEAILKAVNPKYMVISCGTGNSYGHPSQEILDRMDEYKITYYRTDLLGTIIAESDGKDISWTFNSADEGLAAVTLAPADTPTAPPEPTPEQAPKPAENESVIVYITKTGEKYHKAGCSYLGSNNSEISLDDAKSDGYTPCSRCNPPQ